MIALSFIFRAQIVLASAFKTDLGPRPYIRLPYLAGKIIPLSRHTHTHTHIRSPTQSWAKRITILRCHIS